MQDVTAIGSLLQKPLDQFSRVEQNRFALLRRERHMFGVLQEPGTELYKGVHAGSHAIVQFSVAHTITMFK